MRDGVMLQDFGLLNHRGCDWLLGRHSSSAGHLQRVRQETSRYFEPVVAAEDILHPIKVGSHLPVEVGSCLAAEAGNRLAAGTRPAAAVGNRPAVTAGSRRRRVVVVGTFEVLLVINYFIYSN